MMSEHKDFPTFLYDTSLGTYYADIDVNDLYRDGFDGKLSAKSLIASRKILGHDATIGSVALMDLRSFGAEFQLFEDRPPVCSKRPFGNVSDMDGHEPSDVEGRSLNEIIKSYNIVKDMDPDCALVATIPSQFLTAALLRGLEALMMDIQSDNGAFDDVMRFSMSINDIITERIVDETEPDASLIPGAYDNVDLIGLEKIDKYIIPSLAHTNDLMGANGLPTIFHPHGTLTEGDGVKALEHFIGVGFDCIYYGEGNDHGKMMKLCENRVSTMGGIDTFTTIFMGPDDRVVNDTMKIMKETRNNNHIFTCSCSVDRGLDAHRMELMMKTVRRE